MKLLSIDGSTKATGIAIFQDSKLIYYTCLTNNKNNVFDRIYFMNKQIENIYCKYLPDKIIMEEVLPADVKHNQSVYKALIYLQAYVVLTLSLQWGAKIQFYEASHWRKLCGIKTGKGIKREALKEASQNFVKEKYNLKVNDDISDAICLGWAYLQQNTSAF